MMMTCVCIPLEEAIKPSTFNVYGAPNEKPEGVELGFNYWIAHRRKVSLVITCQSTTRRPSWVPMGVLCGVAGAYHRCTRPCP